MGRGVTGLDQSYRIALPDLIRLGFDQADTVFLGDTDHFSHAQIYGAVAHPAVLAAAAEQGAGNVFLELPTYRQGLVDEFQAQLRSANTPVDYHGFAYRFQHEDVVDHNVGEWVFAAPEQTQDFLQNSVSPLITQATRFGMDVHMLDPENGEYEKSVRNDSRRAAVLVREEMRQIWQSGDLSSPAVQGRLSQLRTEYRGHLQQYETYQRAFLETRNHDLPQAERVNQLADGQKSLVLYGATHGSRVGDFEEGFAGGGLKIDIALSRAHYEQEYGARLERFNTLGFNFGEDPADLVYFLDEGVVATTSATPPEVVQALSSGGGRVSDISNDIHVEYAAGQDREIDAAERFRLGFPRVTI